MPRSSVTDGSDVIQPLKWGAARLGTAKWLGNFGCLRLGMDANLIFEHGSKPARCSPSPRPSPSGRGRPREAPGLRGGLLPQPAVINARSASPQAAPPFSLSRRERAGVRGKESYARSARPKPDFARLESCWEKIIAARPHSSDCGANK